VLRAAILFILISVAAAAWAQQEGAQPEGKPQVRLNYLNVCSPSQEEQLVIKYALSKVPLKPAFAVDFEISKGRATLKDAPPSRFVRLRRDFAPESVFMTAQYSMSTDEKSTIETFVARTRDPKEFHEISIEDRVSSHAASPVTVIATDTPAERVRIERLGKGSVVLARCEGADQSIYEPLFRQASDIMAQYRQALGLRGAFRSDIAWLAAASKTSAGQSPQPAKKSP
jgi:hypothetical protein